MYYIGHSMPNQHEKMSVSPDFNETWGTHTLPQVIIIHRISGQSVIILWLHSFGQPNYGRFLVPNNYSLRHAHFVKFSLRIIRMTLTRVEKVTSVVQNLSGIIRANRAQQCTLASYPGTQGERRESSPLSAWVRSYSAHLGNRQLTLLLTSYVVVDNS